MKTVLVAVGVCLVSVVNLAAQWTPAVPSDAVPTVMRLRAATTGFTSGPSGDLWMDAPSPFPTYGAQLVAHSQTPDILAKLGTADASSWFAIDNVNNSELMRVRADGNIGIGTTNPQNQLHVNGGTNNAAIRVDSKSDITGGPSAGFLYMSSVGPYDRTTLSLNAFYNGRAWYLVQTGKPSWLMQLSTGANPNDDDVYKILRSGPAQQGNPAWQQFFTINSSGYVGIGTSTPSQILDVNGNINVTGNIAMGGNINAKYQDVAEWVPVAEEMPAGTVVVVSGITKNTVAPSQRAYDTRVAGVVSDRPGVILGEASSTKAKIATTGRVKVRVDATRHRIAMGDLLVTSDKPGLAMFSEPLDLGGVKIHRPGTLIGKALEPLPGGQGEILVLLSLQ